MKEIKRQKAGNALLRFLQGVLLGSSAILPGISGGVLCVVFGIYKPLMEVLVNPVKKIKEYWKMLLPLGAGGLIGFLLIANVLGTIMENNAMLAECIFLGLILGTLPALFRTAGGEKRKVGSYVALLISFSSVFFLFMYLEHFLDFSAPASTPWFVGAGVIFGISIVLPGLSAYTILEVLGLFDPLLSSVQNLDFGILIPVGIGGAAALILLSKLINVLYEKQFSIMSHIIIGIVIATTIPLIPISFSGVGDFFVQLLLMIVGFTVAMVFSHFEDKLEK
ncbi:MAG: DUF368 domain-containing protein [Clostridia bacterium]|nr:DUF368 domain-containing protein [Clostridia bacterium]